MRDPFGFISYRVGPPPNVIISTVWWSLAIILVVTVGVQAGSTGIAMLKEKYGKRSDNSVTTQATGDYEIEAASSEDDGGASTFEATPYETDDASPGLTGSGLPPMPGGAAPAPVAK